MPKNYTEAALQHAYNAVKRDKMKVFKAARVFGVPSSTLDDKVKGRHQGQRGPARQLNDEEERSLINYLTYMANQGFPLTRGMARCFVQEIVIDSGRATSFNLSNGPSDGWFRKFFSRNPQLSQRKPENMDRARIGMSTPKMLEEFYPFVLAILDKYGVKDQPHRIFNCDETGFSGKEVARTKVIGPAKGHVYRRKTLTSDHVTVHLCVSADGRFLPPGIIFKGGFPHQNFKDGIPVSWHFGQTDSGYMTKLLFKEWFFSVFVPNCGRERPVVLFMDNHDSHISVPVIEKALSDDIVLVGLPGHSTHILQPLDVNIIAPLKDEFTKVVAGLGQLAKCVTIGKARFPIVLKHSMDRVTPATVVDGFVKTGLCPYDPNAIDQSQIVEPSFADAPKSSDTEAQTSQNVSVSCYACGYCLQNPMVKRGLVSEKLANILVPPPEKPLAEKKN